MPLSDVWLTSTAEPLSHVIAPLASTTTDEGTSLLAPVVPNSSRPAGR